MFDIEPLEREQPDQDTDTDPGEVFIPSVPWDDDNPPESEDTDDEDNDKDGDES